MKKEKLMKIQERLVFLLIFLFLFPIGVIAQQKMKTGVPEKGYVIVTVNNVRYIVYFYKIESGWNIEKVEECL